jgi:uncharacterized protein YpmS
MEKQLCKWSNLLRIGKKLTIDIVFAYRTDDDAVSTPASRKGDKRGRVSTTRTQLAECDAYIADKKSEQEGLHAGTMFMRRCVIESAHAPWVRTGVG